MTHQETVGATENFGGIPHRAVTYGKVNDDGAAIWFIEYDQANNGYWGPRGGFTEKDGKYFFDGDQFTSTHDVLIRRWYGKPVRA